MQRQSNNLKQSTNSKAKNCLKTTKLFTHNQITFKPYQMILNTTKNPDCVYVASHLFLNVSHSVKCFD